MSDINKTLQQTKEALDRAIEQKKSNQELLRSIGPAVIDILQPVLNRIENAVSSIKVKVEPKIEINPEVKIPLIKIPDIFIPEIKVPQAKINVSVPPIKIPEIKMPDEMDIKGWVNLMGYDKGFLNNPLPVQLRDKDGKPVNLFENLTTLVSQGGGGGKHDYFQIRGFNQSSFAEILNSDGRVKVELPAGSLGLTDNELRASAVPVSQVSGARWSTEATQGTSPWVISATDLDIRDLINASDSISAYQVSGANWSVYATGFGASVGASLLNGDGNAYDARDRNWTITETVVVSGALDTIKASGIARQTNPTAVSDGDNQRISTDDLGRILTRPMQVRDLTLTAYASLTNGTETTLKAAIAGSYLDLIYIMGANNSDAAVTVDIRAITAGNVMMTLQVPANGTAGIACPVPLPQDETGNNWTVDLPDITGTTVFLTALFSREI